jgi:hypothetical protein
MKERKINMKIVYKAFDGTEFNDEPACKSYEYTKTKKSIVMLDCNGDVAPTPAQAIVVWLKDREANEIFHALAKECGDEEAANTISKYDFGVFYWDEGLEEYRWLSQDILDGLTKLRDAVAAVGGEI